LKLLGDLNGDASPHALGQLPAADRIAAFTPTPTILPTSDILFDAWALTTIREKLPGRPPVEAYLHGLAGWDPPETSVAWREEVGVITGELLERYKPEDLLDDYPLKPHELLRDRSDRVLKHLAALAERRADGPVWLLNEDGSVEVSTLGELAGKGKKDRLSYRTVLLPPAVGGLRDGLLSPGSEIANDVADEWRDESGNRRRVRLWDNDPNYTTKRARMRCIREIVCNDEDEDDEGRSWRWFERPAAADSEGSKTAEEPVTWEVHTKDVTDTTERIVKGVYLPKELQDAVVVAAKFHDLGKKRELWQRSIGNPNPKDRLLAKSGGKMKPRELSAYRHEFGSLIDIAEKAMNEPEFQKLSKELKEVVLHLIASHHGRGRPHFPPDEAFDPEPKGQDVSAIAAAVPHRFARLQRKYGRWGLAYLESLLRAADYAASAEPSKTESDQ
jgi:CRISPR-associated endonuclease/helicase Cas3